MKKLGSFLVALTIVIGGLTIVNHHKQLTVPQAPPLQTQSQSTPEPRKPQISVTMPTYLPYSALVTQLDKWHEEAPDLTERGSYGKSSQGQLLQYIRVTNMVNKQPKKVVMITGCVHGNEPLSCGTVMAYLGAILSKYGTDSEVTELLNTRDIYFIPVVSPDSYPNNRIVDGVDPNRNFPCPHNPNQQSVPPIKAIQDFVLKIKPSATISGHTWGRSFLVPWGDSMTNCPDYDAYKALVQNKMCGLANYRFMRACDMYGANGLNVPPPHAHEAYMPIYGGELDWYYRQGSFAIVIEMGTHQHIPTINDIQSEFNATYKAVLLFIKEAPLIKLKNSFSRNK